jgi:hypothetical protein
MHIVIYAESYIQAVYAVCYLAECRGAEEEEVSGFEYAWHNSHMQLNGRCLTCFRSKGSFTLRL